MIFIYHTTIGIIWYIFIDFYRYRNGKIDRDPRGLRKTSNKNNENKDSDSDDLLVDYKRASRGSISTNGFRTRSFNSKGWAVKGSSPFQNSVNSSLLAIRETSNFHAANEHDKSMELLKRGYVEAPNGMLIDLELKRELKRRAMSHFD